MQPPDKAEQGPPGNRFVWVGLGALTIAFHLGLIFYGLVPNLVSRPLHMALALPWVLVVASRRGAERR